MKNLLFFFFILVCHIAFSQVKRTFPQNEINAGLNNSYLNKGVATPARTTGSTIVSVSGILQLEKIKSSISLTSLKSALRRSNGTFQQGDTVIVGVVPHDTLRITGTYLNNGPIIVANDGVLIIHNAHATIIGDIYAFGMGRILADSSSLSFPQQYFYQLGIIAAQQSYIHIESCTLSFSGMSHSMEALDTATVELINNTNNDWTTAGVYGHAAFIVNGTNLAGEYILNEYGNLFFSHVNTLLLWHQFSASAVVNFAFPKGDTLNHYLFNSSVSGVSGVNYSASVDSSFNVSWGMMPANGSDITISNSTIRTIGAWFDHGDTAKASGLVNNSAYTDFVAPLNDRNLHLVNCSVQTWSLYIFDSSRVTISGCILGEVGSQGRSVVQSSNFFLDGSGGYFWATDTSLIVAGNMGATANVRSERYGFFLLAYSSVTSGIASAIGNSVLAVVQSAVPQDPVAYDGAVAWLANISQPATAVANTIVPVTGSAWIDEGPLGSYMHYGSYSLYYQLSGAVNWTNLVKDSTIEIRNTNLAMWNTNGLADGNYLLMLVLKNNLGDSVQAMKGVTLLPSILNVSELKENYLNIWPNPVKNQLSIKNEEAKNTNISIFNVFGQQVQSLVITGNGKTDVSALSSGIYFVEATGDNKRWVGRFVKE